MTQRRRGAEGEHGRDTAARVWSSAGAVDSEVLIKASLNFLDELPVRGPFRIPHARSGMYRRGNAEIFQLGPHGIIERVSKVMPFEEHRPDERALEASDSCDAA